MGRDTRPTIETNRALSQSKEQVCHTKTETYLYIDFIHKQDHDSLVRVMSIVHPIRLIADNRILEESGEEMHCQHACDSKLATAAQNIPDLLGS